MIMTTEKAEKAKETRRLHRERQLQKRLREKVIAETELTGLLSVISDDRATPVQKLDALEKLFILKKKLSLQEAGKRGKNDIERRIAQDSCKKLQSGRSCV